METTMQTATRSTGLPAAKAAPASPAASGATGTATDSTLVLPPAATAGLSYSSSHSTMPRAQLASTRPLTHSVHQLLAALAPAQQAQPQLEQLQQMLGAMAAAAAAGAQAAPRPRRSASGACSPLRRPSSPPAPRRLEHATSGAGSTNLELLACSASLLGALAQQQRSPLREASSPDLGDARGASSPEPVAAVKAEPLEQAEPPTPSPSGASSGAPSRSGSQPTAARTLAHATSGLTAASPAANVPSKMAEILRNVALNKKQASHVVQEALGLGVLPAGILAQLQRQVQASGHKRCRDNSEAQQDEAAQTAAAERAPAEKLRRLSSGSASECTAAGAGAASSGAAAPAQQGEQSEAVKRLVLRALAAMSRAQVSACHAANLAAPCAAETQQARETALLLASRVQQQRQQLALLANELVATRSALAVRQQALQQAQQEVQNLTASRAGQLASVVSAVNGLIATAKGDGLDMGLRQQLLASAGEILRAMM